MPRIFIQDELFLLLKFVANGNNFFTWLIGGLKDTDAMKNRLKKLMGLCTTRTFFPSIVACLGVRDPITVLAI